MGMLARVGDGFIRAGLWLARSAYSASKPPDNVYWISGGSSWSGGGFWGHDTDPGTWQKGQGGVLAPAVLAFSTVYACIACISGDIAKLDFRALRRNDEGGYSEATTHPVSRILRRPNNYQTAMDFIQAWLVSSLLAGNTYVLVEFDGAYRPIAWHILDPRRLSVLVTDDGDVWYQIQPHPLAGVPNEEGSITVPARYIIHHRLMTLAHPLIGVTPLYAAANSALMGGKILDNSSAFYQNAVRPSGLLTAPGKISKETAERLEKHWTEKFGRGGVGQIAVAGDGLEFKALTLNAVDAQLIEQLRFSGEDVARCFVPGTEILTSGGLKPIESIAVGDMVLTHKGRWRRVEQTIRSHYVGRVLKVQAKGLKSITATANHPFYVQVAKPNRSHGIETVGDAEWILAENMVPSIRRPTGERSRRAFHNLVMPRLVDGASESIDLANWAPEGSIVTETQIRVSLNHRATAINRHAKPDYAFGWLCGIYAADGSKGDHQVIFYLGEHETEISELLRRRLRDVFGVESSVAIARSVCRVTVSNRVLRKFFEQFGTGAENKSFPSWCMDQCDDFRAGLVAGLVDGDGCVNGPRTVVKIASSALAWQARLILWSRGINTCLIEHEERIAEINGWSGVCQKLYTVQWMNDAVRRGAMGIKDDYVFFSLDKLESDIYHGTVYNLEVEEDHSYTTSGGVAHNCFRVPGFLLGNDQKVTYKNSETLARAYYSGCLQYYIEGIEERINNFFDLPADVKVEADLDALLRTDMDVRYSSYATGLNSGFLTINGVRARENLHRVEGGDEPMVQIQYRPLSQAVNPPPGPVPAPTPAPTPDPAPDDPGPDDDPEVDAEDAAASLNVLRDLREAA